VNGFNFTERMRRTLALAREESARLRHEYVGTEHLLFGLLREGGGCAAAVLENLAIDRDGVARRLEQCIRPGRASATPGPDLPYTSRAKRVLEESMAEARELRHSFVGTEHLLLGLLREERGIAAQVLVAAGLTLGAARAETLRILGTELPTQGPPPEYDSSRPVSGMELVNRVEVVLHYRNGEHLRGSFDSAREAADFLNRFHPPPQAP